MSTTTQDKYHILSLNSGCVVSVHRSLQEAEDSIYEHGIGPRSEYQIVDAEGNVLDGDIEHTKFFGSR